MLQLPIPQNGQTNYLEAETHFAGRKVSARLPSGGYPLAPLRGCFNTNFAGPGPANQQGFALNANTVDVPLKRNSPHSVTVAVFGQKTAQILSISFAKAVLFLARPC